MHLVQILLPLAAQDGSRHPRDRFEAVRRELVERFGGLTAYTQAPATGLWEEGERVVRDDVVVYEVMADTLDRGWWSQYRQTLEQRFAQQEVMIRSMAAERL
jgi:hypothetical protein